MGRHTETAAGFYRAGGSHAFQRVAQQTRRAGQHRDHARLRPPAAHAPGKYRIGPPTQGSGEKVRFPVQGGLRRHPAVDDSSGQEAAQDRVQSAREREMKQPRIYENVKKIKGHSYQVLIARIGQAIQGCPEMDRRQKS